MQMPRNVSIAYEMAAIEYYSKPMGKNAMIIYAWVNMSMYVPYVHLPRWLPRALDYRKQTRVTGPPPGSREPD